MHQTMRLAQRRHRVGTPPETLSSPGRADAHPERRHRPTPRRSLVRYFAQGSRKTPCAFLPAQRRHYSSVCRATCEAKRRIIREELDMLNLSLQQNRSVEPRRRRLKARRESIKKELERLSNMEQIERATVS